MNKEGRKIKTLPPMTIMTAYIMPERNDASNIFSAEIDITETDKFIREQRSNGFKGLGLLHVIIAAYIRTVAMYPGINRFIRGQKIYARNSIEICLTIKKKLLLNTQDTVIKYFAKPTDTLCDVYEGINGLVEDNRREGDTNNMDNAARLLVHIPSVFLKFTIWLLKSLDYFGLLPRFLTKLSPFHASMFITNMGSLGISSIYHHLYNFGNVPIFISLGSKRTAYITNSDGSVEKRKFIDLKVVCDERICDGHYYASAFKSVKKCIENAQILSVAPDCVKEDIE